MWSHPEGSWALGKGRGTSEKIKQKPRNKQQVSYMTVTLFQTSNHVLYDHENKGIEAFRNITKK